MIITTNLLPNILRVLKGSPSRSLIPVTRPLPYSWNPKQNKFQVLSTYSSWWWLVVCCVYFSGIIFQALAGKIKTSEVAIGEDVMRIHFSLMYIVVAGF